MPVETEARSRPDACHPGKPGACFGFRDRRDSEALDDQEFPGWHLRATSDTISGVRLSLYRGGVRSVAWWASAACLFAVLVADLWGRVANGTAHTSTYAYVVTVGLWGSVGLFVWATRPRQGLIGPLWTLAPLFLAVENLFPAWPESRFVATIVLASLGLGAGIACQWVLAYPSGVLPSRQTRIGISVLYVVGTATNLPFLLYYPISYLYVGEAPFDLGTYNRVIAVAWVAPMLVWLAAMYIVRLRGLSPAVRRSAGPVLVAALIYTPFFALVTFPDLWGTDLGWEYQQDWVNIAGFWAYMVLGLSGLFFVQRARGNVGDLVVELNRVEPGQVRAALAQAVGDPTLEVGLWLPDRDAWVDEQGEPLHLPPGEGRHATYIGERLAVVVHELDLVDQPALLEAAGSAARLALENARLQAELRAQLVELRDSRARIVRAGDEERRRLERDLHDGAQQRLLALGMGLQLLRGHVDPSGKALLTESEIDLQQALRELRELAQGIHPAALTDNGLADAVRTLALRAPVPVTVDVDEHMGRLPGHVETAAYFVVAESLANVAKYAEASEAWVMVGRENGSARIEIRDDGRGGAAPDGGTGIRGLADRVGALDGSLTIESPSDGGTRIVAEIPCA